ncbi:MAG TPA: metal ABC transporter permease [Halanaerobiales bacterium]|nr:metal ABC transporter permease [Halanaerobiales bacterium]
MPEFLTYNFMQRAFIIGNIIALIAPLIGVFLILRRLALIGNTISHVALAGIALGLFLGIYPVYMAILVSVVAALGIEKLRNSYQDYAELSLSVILASGLGLATILISLSSNSSGIMSYLFGSITLVNRQDIYLIVPLGIVIVSLLVKYYYGFFYISFNEREARLAGVPVSLLNFIFMFIISITISISVRVIGALLIASLISLPVAAAIQIARSFKQTIIFSIIIALISVNTGLIVSFYCNLAPGGTIILTNVVWLLFILLYKGINKKTGRKRWNYG